jgi:hypothetical protein
MDDDRSAQGAVTAGPTQGQEDAARRRERRTLLAVLGGVGVAWLGGGMWPIYRSVSPLPQPDPFGQDGRAKVEKLTPADLARPGRRPAAAGAVRFLGSGLPLGFSYLVTFGVPPLLFVQVMYGQFFYSSSVLVGAFWICVIPLLITGYGATYLHKLMRDRRPRLQLAVAGVALACLLAIGFSAMLTRAELKRQYQETVPEAGIFRITNITNGKALLGSSLNLHGPLNKHRFLLAHGLHPERPLQEDWNRLAASR